MIERKPALIVKKPKNRRRRSKIKPKVRIPVFQPGPVCFIDHWMLLNASEGEERPQFWKFHVIMVIAALYMSMVLTNWEVDITSDAE